MYGELAAAQILIDSGCTLRYEQMIEDLAPDWACQFDGARFICEVFPAGLPELTGAHAGAVMQLTGRLSAIPQPYLIRLEAPIDFALDSSELKKVSADVSAWLAGGVRPGDDWSASQCTITVLGLSLQTNPEASRLPLAPRSGERVARSAG